MAVCTVFTEMQDKVVDTWSHPMSISLWAKLFLDELVRACLDEGGTLPHTSRSKAPDCLCLFRRENLVDLGSWKLEACRAGPDEELIYSWSRLVISGWICAADGFFFSPEPAQETGKLPDTWMRLPRQVPKSPVALYNSNHVFMPTWREDIQYSTVTKALSSMAG